MRLLLTSDLHYRLRQIDWIQRVADNYDAIVIAGDTVDAFSAVPGEVQVEALRASMRAISEQAPLLLCSGNHDLDTRNEAGEKQAQWLQPLRGERIAVDGDSVVHGDTLFTVCPWWDGPHAREQVGELLEAAAQQRTGDWVWLYHAPPEGPLSWTGRRHFGDDFLPELIERHAPTAVCCGHIHEAPFKRDGGWTECIGNTHLFNAGHQIGDTPAHIEIDLKENAARWVSLAGVEEVALAT